MVAESVNSSAYYFVVGVQIIIGLVILISAIMWGVADQAKNLKMKKWSGVFFLIFCSIFYLIRFGAISVLAGLRTGQHISIGVSLFKSLLRLIQLVFISIVPSFFLIESYIFKYQHLIIDHHDSKAQERKYLIFAVGLPIVIALALQLMISLL